MSEAVRTPGGPGYTQISPTYDPYGAPYPPPQPAQTPRNGAKAPVLLAVIAVVVAVAVAVLAVLGAVVVPRVMRGHVLPPAPAPEVEVTLPTHLLGWTKVPAQGDDLAASAEAKLPAGLHARAAVYARAGVPKAVIVLVPYRMNRWVQQANMSSAAAAEVKHGVRLRTIDAGPLGGRMQCGGTAANGGHTDCAFADSGAFGMISLIGRPQDFHATVLAIRANVEHRVG